MLLSFSNNLYSLLFIPLKIFPRQFNAYSVWWGLWHQGIAGVDQILWVVERGGRGVQLFTDLTSHFLVTQVAVAAPDHGEAPGLDESAEEMAQKLA